MLTRLQPQKSFGDGALDLHVSDSHFLLKVDRSAYDVHWPGLYGTTGKPSHDPLVCFKMLLIEQWYNLSDPECEAQCADRLSVRRFLGKGRNQWRHRRLLLRHGATPSAARARHLPAHPVQPARRRTRTPADGVEPSPVEGAGKGRACICQPEDTMIAGALSPRRLEEERPALHAPGPGAQPAARVGAGRVSSRVGRVVPGVTKPAQNATKTPVRNGRQSRAAGRSAWDSGRKTAWREARGVKQRFLSGWGKVE